MEWADSGERVKRWAMPIQLAYSDSMAFIGKLVSEGLVLEPDVMSRRLLAKYIVGYPTPKTFTCTDRIGWLNPLENDAAFVFPDQTIGANSDRIVYQSEGQVSHRFNCLGTLDEWQKNVAALCVGNPLLMFAVSSAFCPVFFPFLDVTRGGFHFFGLSSEGKTTLLHAAGSVFGGGQRGYFQSWKTTPTALEITAALHNHCLLCLDEIGECENSSLAEISYMLANGAGKARGTKTLSSCGNL